MKRIRIGKDIAIRWTVLTNGEAKSLHGRKLKLMLHHSFMPEQEIQFSIDQTEDNKIVAIFRGVNHKTTGEYRLTLWENYGLDGQTAVDYCNAFELVNTTCEEGGDDAEGLDTETVELEDSDIETGIPGADGKSAYELFKKYNPDSPLTEKEYSEVPINSAKKADEAAKDANATNEQIAKAESLRVEAESSRIKAEGQRVQAESGRVNAESERENAETARVNAEGQRASAEDERKRNEASRVNAESTRATNEEKRVSDENTRVSAEAKRNTQEKSRQDAEAIRVSNEKGRVSAEEQRVIAENERDTAEEERDKSVDKALSDMSDAIDNANDAATRAAALADNPPKIVEVNGMAYWAFYDLETKKYVTSQHRADDGTIVQQVEGSAVSLDVKGGTMYVCGELTSLTIASVENSTKPSIIRFTSGATATQFSFPDDFNITGWTKPEENKSYTICILFGAGNMTYDE